MEKKYLKVYNELLKKIKNGDFPPNSLLPSEPLLMKQYNLSRDTIRKALTILKNEGYIQKSRGKGSIVLDINRFDFSFSGVISFKEISKKLDKRFETEVHFLNEISSQLDCLEELGDKLIKVVRTRKIDNESIILDKDYFLPQYVPNLTVNICKNSIYEYLENSLNLKIAYAKKQITVEKITKDDKKYLDLNGIDMVVVVRSYTYLEDSRFFQYTESRHRPDKFIFVDFARRNKYL